LRKQAKLVVVSGADGCVVDRLTFSYSAAEAALGRLQQSGIPLVLCSSRTRAELERLRADIQVSDPFIAENGGAIFVPVDTFPFQPPGAVRRGAYDIIEIGRPHSQVLRLLLSTAARVGVDITTFSDMSVQRVATECGLSLADARLAKLREYDEPFQLVEPNETARAKLLRSLGSAGLRCANGGRYDHVTLGTDKGVAVGLLRRLYSRACGNVTLVGLGAGRNDTELLRGVDVPLVVRSSDAETTEGLLQSVRRARASAAEGPAGWSESLLTLLDGPGTHLQASAGLHGRRV
jgi:mannosyl-3-phosphoglycerate phosphatase